MSDDPMYRRGNPNARPGQPGAQRPDDRYFQNGQGAPQQDPYARGADASRPPAYSGYRQPYPEPDRSRQAPVPDYRQAPPPPPPPPSFSAPGEGRAVEHRGYHDNGAQDLRPRPSEPPRAPAYDPQAAYYQGEDVYQNQYAEPAQSNQAYAPPPNPAYAPPPPPPPYQAPPQDYGQRDSYRQPAAAQPPMGYGSAPSNGMAQNDDAHSRFFLNSGPAQQAPQERAPAPPPPLPQNFDFAPASNGNSAAFYAEPEDQTDPGWSHYEPDSMLPPASVAPDRRHADDDLDADFFADEEDFEAAHAYAPEKKGGRLKMVLAVLLGTALVGGGGMYAYKTLLGGKRMAGDTATITADNTPFKEQPNDPGGRQFANQGKKIYERLENMTDAQAPDAPAAAPAPSSSPSSFDDRLNQAMQRGRPADDAQLAQPVDPERPRTVKTETYRPDGSRTETPPAAFPGMAVSGDAPAPGAGRRQVAAANVAAPPAARPAPAAKPVVAAAPPPAATGDGYYLQLSSTQDQARAGTEVNTLQQKYAAVLGGVSLGVREGAVGDKTYYRIKAGPLESKEAGTDLCNRLKTAGMTTLGPCLVNK
jgi:hypothetical protein